MEALMRKSSESTMLVEGLVIAIKDIIFLWLGTILFYYLAVPLELLP
jgi:hypothetical protein